MPYKSAWYPRALAIALCLISIRADAARRRVLDPVIPITSGTPGAQQLSRSIAARPDGTFVSTWTSASLIYFARHNANGSLIGGATGVGVGEFATVACDSSGNFVIVWVGYEGDNSYGIYAQRYLANGTVDGPTAHVNEHTPNNQMYPAVAMNASGAFVVAWQSAGQDGDLSGVYARAYPAGSVVPLVSELRVNVSTTSSQVFPSISMKDDGGFIVTWANENASGNSFGSTMRRFDGTATALTGDVPVFASSERAAPVAFLPGGAFVIAYWNAYQAYVQRYDAAGAANGQPIHVATHVFRLDLNANASGTFALVWESTFSCCPAESLVARLYDASGTALTGTTVLHTPEGGQKFYPWVAVKPNDEAVFSWSRQEHPGFQFELRQSRFRRAARLDIDGDLNGDLVVRTASTGALWNIQNLAIRSSSFPWTNIGDRDMIGSVYIDGSQMQQMLFQHRTTRAVITPMGSINPNGDWRARGTGDFDGDTRTDLVLQNATTGEVAIWLLDTYTIRAGAVIGVAALEWDIRAVADIDADGRDDLILQHRNTRDIAVWKMNGFVITYGAVLASVPDGWVVRTSGDFNNDDRYDLALQNSVTGQIAIWLMNDTQITGGIAAQIPTSWVIGGAGDYNADGRDDLALMNSADGTYVLWAMNGATVTQGKVIGTAPGWSFAMQPPVP